MRIKLISVGKTSQKEIINLFNDYQKRLPKAFNFESLEIKELKNRNSISEVEQKNQEAKLILDQLNSNDFIILLDERGKSFTSKEFANYINQKLISNQQSIVFIIGGPYGFGEEIIQIANDKISFSAMTFTHQMIRLFFIEQLYRAYTILANKKYHHE